ncbi:MAG: NACHT domain-containing protein [Gloeotrichia echinulata DVL01]|jgi:hypothetical protein|nr:NACHT domain-containing protein [Gloeotrichia echinulata DEX184]
MIDWLVAWGVANSFGLAFKAVLEKLAQAALEDYVKDFFKGCIKDLTHLAKAKPLKVAYGQANKLFLDLVQEELEDAGLEEKEIKQEYSESVDQFINHKTVIETLGQPLEAVLDIDFVDDKPAVDVKLTQIWHDLNLKPLPREFQWQHVTKVYCRKVRAIAQESEELRQLLDSANLAKMRERLEENSPIVADFDFSRYQKGLKTAYSRLRLDSLDTSGCNYTLQLWNIFVPQNLREMTPYPGFSCSILDILNEKQTYKYTVILGNPGSGKSTLAQYKALDWAITQSSYLSVQELPLLIELRNYLENRERLLCSNFLEYFHKGTGVVGGTLNQIELDKWLKNNQAIVLFDGLDEVLNDRERENVVIDIINFTHHYPQARVIVTSRIIGYEQQQHRFRNANFREFVIQELAPEQIHDFVSKWHELAFDDKYDAEKKRDRLQKSIENYFAFRELAGNPLLLTMMAILNRHEELPRDRATLYERASEVLLQRWDGDKNLPEDKRLDPKLSNYLDYKAKQEMLRLVAYRMQASAGTLAQSLVISQADLEDILTNYLQNIVPNKEAKLVARVLREQLTTRSFILCFLGGDVYGFMHRTFLEYFCALYYAEQYEKKRQITLEYLKQEIFGNHWHDPSWYEVLALILGKIYEKFASEIIDYLIDQDGRAYNFINLFLAHQCLCNVRNHRQMQSTANKLLEKFQQLAVSQDGLTDTIRNQAVAAIAVLEDLPS